MLVVALTLSPACWESCNEENRNKLFISRQFQYRLRDGERFFDAPGVFAGQLSPDPYVDVIGYNQSSLSHLI
jgi:hypothetical protein